MLNLSGTNLYSGGTAVNAGVLNLNGVLQNSAVTVYSGAVISGNGTMASLNAMSGSIVSPSLNVGTASALNVTGNFAFASDATYALNALSNGTSDQLLINGNATLGGGNVMVRGPMVAGMQYNILTADGGLSGIFQQLYTENVSDFLVTELVYSDTAVALNVVRNNTSLPISAGGGATCGGGLPGIGEVIGTLPGNNPIVVALLNTTVANAASGLQQLSGEAHATSKSMLMGDARFGQRLITARLNSSLGISDTDMATVPLGNTIVPTGIHAPLDTIVTGAISSTSGFDAYPDVINLNVYDGGTVWMQGYGAWGSIDGSPEKSGFKRDVGGFYAGVDAPLADWLVGIAGGYSHTDFHTKGVRGSGDVDTWRVSLYGGTHYKWFNFRMGVQQAEHDRHVTFRGFCHLS